MFSGQTFLVHVSIYINRIRVMKKKLQKKPSFLIVLIRQMLDFRLKSMCMCNEKDWQEKNVLLAHMLSVRPFFFLASMH